MRFFTIKFLGRKPIYYIQVRPNLKLIQKPRMACVETGGFVRMLFFYLFCSRTIERGWEKGDYLIISSSNVGMESARTYRSSTTRTLSFSAKTTLYSLADNKNALGNQDLLGNSDESLETNEENAKTSANESANSTNDAMERLKGNSVTGIDRIRQIAQGTEQSAIERIREKCILHLWELFFGRDRASELAEEYNFESVTYAQPRQLNVMEVTAMEEYSFEETETMDFSAKGCVVTADGREISFNMDVSMSRSFSEYYKIESTDYITMCDPLVINLDDNVVGLSDQKFFFDLNMDGVEEEISTLEKGNAFLSLDKNNDGKINDGSELFGAASGNGFADLAQYDEDGNGWIDEADSIYNKLKIWVKDANGEDMLYTLREKNVGAIYLGSQSTDYTLRSAQTGNINGMIRRSGFFLYEDGAAGSIAHVDMTTGISESA